MTVWMLAEKLLSNSTGDPDVELRSWLLSFFKIPTIHERYGDGSSRATIVHTIARQEQDVAVEGLDDRLDHHQPLRGGGARRHGHDKGLLWLLPCRS